jgi:hypothetical protein
VIHERDDEQRVVLVLDLDDGRRTLRVIGDPALAREASSEDLCGRRLELGAEGAVRWS